MQQSRLEQEPLVLALRACRLRGRTASFAELLEEFAAMVSVDAQSHEGLRRAWKFLDAERRGSIRAEDLARVSEKFSLGLGPQEIANMIERGDADGDGEVTFDELSSLLLGPASA
uniref:EF-hand domain-containing protein n=1 Tax=Alexandrium catenella TaxID=2925 RepID=A0A7S1PVN7_ALECA